MNNLHETWTSCREIVMSLSFYQLMVNLKQSGRRIPDALPLRLNFLLIIIFYFTKTEIRARKSLTQLSHYNFK